MGTILVYTLDPSLLVGWNYPPGAEEKALLLEQYRNLPMLGGWFGKDTTGNLETIMQSHPDVMISMGDPLGVAQAERVQAQTHIPVFVIKGGFDNFPAAYEKAGELLGSESRAAMLAEECRKAVNEIRQKVSAIPLEKRRRYYYAEGPKGQETEPGSSMHIHQSVVDKHTGRNLFADSNGRDSALFRAHVAGLQRYLPMVMPLLAPNVNSYRRLQPYSDAPINVHWGRDNRTVGFRVPVSSREGRRVENRVAGADANPYLALAASLACGYLGMVNGMEPTDPIKGTAHRLAFTLPRHLMDALNKFNACKPLREIIGEDFVRAVISVKTAEYEAYQRVISSWERENLLLNV